ncbi:hypothetical protein Pint_36150 [Pistacia integerrima]|uniref:Uncharacterized protein n=1 Tax=Pistacia integerrima TaxID=434235 RepID=A0ACC0Y0F2_9ROSI|nr:hypothetical protein Pint_36150 [Pistacia integerrima]
METKTINSINKEIYRSYIVEKLLLAIRDKWLRIDARSPIFIQQDNAKPHIGLDDEYFQSNATKDGFDIRLICQPPNSLDMNVLDLGFLNAIQALQYQQAPNSVDVLIEAIQKSFEEYSPTKLNHTFLTLQSCMISILKVGGLSKYKVSHMKKHRLEGQNCLPSQLDVDLELIGEAIAQ